MRLLLLIQIDTSLDSISCPSVVELGCQTCHLVITYQKLLYIVRVSLTLITFHSLLP